MELKVFALGIGFILTFGMGGKRQIRLSVIKGVGLTGRYMIYIHGQQLTEERAFDFMYGSFFLAEDKTCGKAFCYNDVVTHKDYPRQRAVIKGIGYNGKYLIILVKDKTQVNFSVMLQMQI